MYPILSNIEIGDAIAIGCGVECGGEAESVTPQATGEGVVASKAIEGVVAVKSIEEIGRPGASQRIGEVGSNDEGGLSSRAVANGIA